MISTFLLSPSSFTDPLNYWSLWVPIALLGTIVAAAIYFLKAD